MIPARPSYPHSSQQQDQYHFYHVVFSVTGLKRFISWLTCGVNILNHT